MRKDAPVASRPARALCCFPLLLSVARDPQPQASTMTTSTARVPLQTIVENCSPSLHRRTPKEQPAPMEKENTVRDRHASPHLNCLHPSFLPPTHTLFGLSFFFFFPPHAAPDSQQHHRASQQDGEEDPTGVGEAAFANSVLPAGRRAGGFWRQKRIVSLARLFPPAFLPSPTLLF